MIWRRVGGPIAPRSRLTASPVCRHAAGMSIPFARRLRFALKMRMQNQSLGHFCSSSLPIIKEVTAVCCTVYHTHRNTVARPIAKKSRSCLAIRVNSDGLQQTGDFPRGFDTLGAVCFVFLLIFPGDVRGSMRI